jgi:biopolymer transport protein ExbB/TolQ
MNIGDLLFQVLMFSLLLLGAVSFMLFLRRLLRNAKVNEHNSEEINKKLDRIIELLEKRTK